MNKTIFEVRPENMMPIISEQAEGMDKGWRTTTITCRLGAATEREFGFAISELVAEFCRKSQRQPPH